MRQSTFELDSIFGLGDDANSFAKNIEFYHETLPAIIFPIADLPGGDLVCMDKESNKIYFWFHEMEDENIFLVAENFQEFIMSFQHEQVERANLDDIKLNLSSELDSALRNVARKYRE
ncbi:SMI1/KNR4 family protein [Bacillus bingmayongensis]|uniref:SMI1/KNR4 family protein n=1 Tax=Bacillus bingmayongensis TaxID=1150157 RepID=UPI001C8D38DA|nr:SMI1/KNR4 family protein [Bacillus bingmayongensis]MBY0595220.1 SMI1/KNR4 family protein [Bacillus bingmayongensis]